MKSQSDVACRQPEENHGMVPLAERSLGAVDREILNNDRTLHRVAEEVWRLEQRLDRAARQVEDDALEGVRDALQRLRDILDEAGVQAVDHTGGRYIDGLRVEVLHVEGEPSDDAALRVVRTVRPTIMVDGRVAVSGQVILGPADLETSSQ